MRIAAKIAYDGRQFHGFARQPNLPTVEETLITFLIKHHIIHSLDQAQFRYASRTDKKVSALGNVIAFNTIETPEKIIKKAPLLQKNIILYATTVVDETFFPRYAQLRQYRYYLKKTPDLDIKQLTSILNLFVGTHNFSNYARIEPGKNPIREITIIKYKTQNKFFIIDFYAVTLLWNQIRRIIAAAQKVAQGKTTKNEILTALQQPHMKADFGLAPAEPLLLIDISYPFKFTQNISQYQQVLNLERQIQTSL